MASSAIENGGKLFSADSTPECAKMLRLHRTVSLSWCQIPESRLRVPFPLLASSRLNLSMNDSLFSPLSFLTLSASLQAISKVVQAERTAFLIHILCKYFSGACFAISRKHRAS